MDAELLQQLRTLIGHTLDYSGHSCRVIEILENENALVLQCEDSTYDIQANQFGEATRRVKRCHTLALFDEQQCLNPAIRRWLK